MAEAKLWSERRIAAAVVELVTTPEASKKTPTWIGNAVGGRATNAVVVWERRGSVGGLVR